MMYFPISDNDMLEEGDVIYLNKDFKITAEIGEYVVVKTVKEKKTVKKEVKQKTDDTGMPDVIPNINHVTCKKLKSNGEYDPYAKEVRFIQEKHTDYIKPKRKMAKKFE